MDSYRPGGASHRPSDERDSYRPRPYGDRGSDRPSWPPSTGPPGMYHFQGSHTSDARDGRAAYRGSDSYRPRPRYAQRRDDPARRDRRRMPLPRLPPRTAADRPLFRLRHAEDDASSPVDQDATSKFRNVDELTDSDDEQMSLSSSDENQDSTADHTPAEPDTATPPRWSNPDPYTALPPSGEPAASKRVDVVKLIRKARIQSERSARPRYGAEDFISFDFDDAAKLDGGDGRPQPAPARTANHDTPAADVPESNDGPAEQMDVDDDSSTPSTPAIPTPDMLDDLPPATDVLGKRKRGQTTGTHSRPAPRSTPHAVLKSWEVAQGADPAPWMTASGVDDMPGVALHKEIIDFYEWVKPAPFEATVRDEVFQRLSRDFRKCVDGRLVAFGSYAAGLYLPTGDMDVVYLTDKFRPGESPSRRSLQLLLGPFARFLRERRIAREHSIVVIPKAKVPIIKFVDRVSGLKVDLSFNNDSGLPAVETVRDWTATYPIMPIMVSLVKQFLMIRGLSDVSRGGLGGFSTICLVTDFLIHMPPQGPVANLGRLLLEFFKLYGITHKKEAIAIRVGHPPLYMSKAEYGQKMPLRGKPGGLTIIDPHREDNNIAAGTTQIDAIRRCFVAAHDALLQALEAHERRPDPTVPHSILACIIGGDFSSYETQRHILRGLHGARAESKAAAKRASTKGAPTTTSSGTSTPSRQAGGKSSEGLAKGAREALKTSSQPEWQPTKGEKRALRLKTLRPDLGPSIANTISVKEAMLLGGYDDAKAMDDDLRSRESAALRTPTATKGKTKPK